MTKEYTPEVKAEWVKRLRSGEFMQTKGVLTRFNPSTTEERFCCLGVLADIVCDSKRFIERGIFEYENEWTHVSPLPLPLPEAYPDTYDNRDGLFQIAFRHTPDFWEYKTFTLVGLNDDGFTFDQIADIVERFF